MNRSLEIDNAEALRYLRKELKDECERIRKLRDTAEKKNFDKLKKTLDKLWGKVCKGNAPKGAAQP